jgi:hypothetical protein
MWVIPEDLGNFSPKKEKNLGEQKFAHLSVSNFRGRVMVVCSRCFELSIGFYGSETILATFYRNWANIFFKSSGCTAFCKALKH